jgi:peroxiredoxin
VLGHPAPDFARRTLAGERLDTTSMRGKVIVLEFFAQYCQPCRQTLPAVQKLHARSNGDVSFIGVSIDEYESTAREIAAGLGLTFPVVHDAGGIRGRYRVTDLPATFVIDPGGRVTWVRIGGSGSTESELARAIASARSG